jgi:RecB family endonuclease NucS
MVPYRESVVCDFLIERLPQDHPNLFFLERESLLEEGNVLDGTATGRYGYIDIMCGVHNKRKVQYFLVEVKKHATTAAIDQIQRYLNWCPDFLESRGAIASFTVAPKALKLIEGTPGID